MPNRRRFHVLIFAILGEIILGTVVPSVCFALDQVVSNCVNDSDLRTKLTAIQGGGGGTLTFNCNPSIATIILSGSLLPSITTPTIVDGANKITISGGNASSIFRVELGADFTLKNMILTKGNTLGSGGAIVGLAPLHIFHVTFLDNHAVTGGAIYAIDSSDIHDSDFILNTSTRTGGQAITGGGAIDIFGFIGNSFSITNCTFQGNKAITSNYSSGGAVILNSATLTVSGSTFKDNDAVLGGGVCIDQGGQLNVSNTTFEHNSASADGGGIANFNILNSDSVTFKDNFTKGTGSGGAITNFDFDSAVYNPIANLTNVTFSGNLVSVFGGAIENYNSTLNIANSTFSGNSAQFGGAIAHHSNHADRGVTLKNTILEKSLSGNNCQVTVSVSTITSTGFDLSDDGSCNFGAGRDLINPKLGPLANNGGPTLTFLPQLSSPAIDSGTIAGCPAKDQRGVSRPFGPTCDIGAVEVGPSPTPTATPSPTPTLDQSIQAARNLLGDAAALVRIAKKILPAKPSPSLIKARKAKVNALRTLIQTARKQLKLDLSQLISLEINAGTSVRTFIATFTKNNLASIKKNVSRAISNNEKSPRLAKKYWKAASKLLTLMNS